MRLNLRTGKRKFCLYYLICLVWIPIRMSQAKQTDPDSFMFTGEIIKYYNYPFEEHDVTAADGMITVLHRIPHGFPYDVKQQRVPVLVFHALLCSSVMMVQNGRNESFAFVLANAGFDVWLANQRGNSYSNRSKHYSIDEETFWDFSWQESSLYDVPASIDYILAKTGSKKLFYIGHSMGAAIGFAMLSLKTEYNEKMHGFIALGPAVYIHHSTSTLAKISPIFSEVFTRLPEYSNRVFSLDFLRPLLGPYCIDKPTLLCLKMIESITGDHTEQFNLDRFGSYLRQIPDTTSFKTLVYFRQVYVAKKFQMFDYGSPELNFKAYNQSQPPIYDLRRVTVPTALYPANYDILSAPADVELLANALPNLRYYSPINSEGFGHLGFIWGKVSPDIVYPNILKVMKIILDSNV